MKQSTFDFRLRRYSLCVGLLILVGLACGSNEGTQPTPEPPVRPNETVEEVLSDFGIDTEETPRLDTDGQALGEDYAPLGSQDNLGRVTELMLMGVNVDETPSSQSLQAVLDLVPDGSNGLDARFLFEPDSTTLPWITTLVRSSAVGDFDGDGLDEVAISYQLPDENAVVQVIDDETTGFVVSDPTVLAVTAWLDVFTEAGDFDGDGDADLLVASVSDTGVRLEFWQSDAGLLTSTDVSVTVEVESPAATWIELATGNLDRDNAIEFGVVFNRGESGSDTSARYALFDDATEGFAELRASSLLSVATENTVYTTKVTNIALGDVDRDGMDEVVLGGLTGVGNTCNLASESAVLVLDDARHNFVEMVSDVREFRDTRDPCASGSSQSINYFPLLTLDIDGDNADEIYAFEHVFEDLVGSMEALVSIAQLPQTELLTEGSSGSNASYRFRWNRVSFTAGDVSSDNREDIIFYKQTGASAEQGVYVWGYDQIADAIQRLVFYPTAFTNSQTPLRTELIAADLEQDQGSMSLRFSEGSHRLIFTEPVVLVALAAPPCAQRGGVDDACRTAYGTATSQTDEETSSASVIAGVSVGFEAEFSALGVKVGGAEAIVNTRNKGTWYGGNAYTLTKSITRETGILEDSVIFTSIPYDVYTYQIVSHPNPELVGGEIQLRYPREPITIMSTVEFYNDAVLEDALKIDDRVFSHTVGEPGTYPTAGEKDQLVRTFKGLQSEQVDVGQGGGFSLVSIAEFEESIDGRSYEFEGTLDLRASKGGIVGGLTIGGGFGFDLSTRKGTETTYHGTVANLSAAAYQEGAYSFGLFSYLLEDSDFPQPFEVLNYWVVE